METIKFTAYDFKFIPQQLLNKMVELQTVDGKFIPHFLSLGDNGEIFSASMSLFDNDEEGDPNPALGDFLTFCPGYVKEARDSKRAVSTLFNAQALILMRAYQLCQRCGNDSEQFRLCCNLLFHMEMMYKYNIHKFVNHRELYKQLFNPVSRKLHIQAMLGLFAKSEFMFSALDH